MMHAVQYAPLPASGTAAVMVHRPWRCHAASAAHTAHAGIRATTTHCTGPTPYQMGQPHMLTCSNVQAMPRYDIPWRSAMRSLPPSHPKD